MANDWIKGPDEEFDTQFEKFNTWVQANGATHGLSAGVVAALNDLYGDWTTAFPAHKAAATAAETARQAKDDKRAECEAAMRPAAATLQAHPDMTDPERIAADITVRSGTRTPSSIPTSRPIGMVDTSKRLQHTIHFKDETTPTSKAKPAGVMGVEIWCYLGPNPPPDATSCSFVTFDTKTPYLVEYDGTDANKIAHYLLRWVSTRGEKGPWSETVSATIGA